MPQSTAVDRITEGSRASHIVIVAEHLGEEELKQKRPFAGASGYELDRLLKRAGLGRTQCYITNVYQGMPPDGEMSNLFYNKTEAKKYNIDEFWGQYPTTDLRAHVHDLWDDLRQIQPHVIIAMGNAALWACAGEWGIMKWRGSLIYSHEGHKVVPTIHPAAVSREFTLGWAVTQDLRKAAHESLSPDYDPPKRNIIIRPKFDEAMDFLHEIRPEQPITCDTETHGQLIDCYGIGIDRNTAICIPFNDFATPHYWTEAQETKIVLAIKKKTQKANCIFHNGLYDLQYTHHDWAYRPNVTDDTMVMMHVCYPGFKKSLDFVASIVCDYYKYWKDEGKLFDPAKDDVEQHWFYNAEDCIYTFEAWENLGRTLDTFGLREQYEFMMELFWPVLDMMLRGVNVNKRQKALLSTQLADAFQFRLDWLEEALGHPMNPNSNPQMQALFYKDLKVKPVINRSTGRPTLAEHAIDHIATNYPNLQPLCQVISECRSIRVFKSTFADMPLSIDERMRTSFNICGTKTFRFSSSTDAFGSGGNLENIPEGTEK